MPNQIIVLNNTTQPDGSFVVGGVFWLTAPTNLVAPNPTFKSQVPKISDADQLLLQQGAIVEAPFTTGLFAPSDTLTVVRAQLQNQLAEEQAVLDAKSPPIASLVGATFDGSAWSNPGPPSPDWLGAQIAPRTMDGRPRMSAEKNSAAKQNFFSHDWADPTTWYEQSVYVAGEVAVDSGDHLTFDLANKKIIDTYHGKITQEDALLDAAGRSYRVAATVNGSPKVEQDPFYGTGGDFTVDYDQGKIVFLAPQPSGATVAVTYHYEHGSRFTVKPSPGMRLTLEQAEVQFSTDLDLRDTMIFEAFGVADHFLTPSQMGAYGIAPNTGAMISIQKFVYKTFSDFQNDAFKAYPIYPAMGLPGNWRSQIQPVTVFDWDYVSSLELCSSKGMEIRMYLEHDEPCVGWMATATMYCTTEIE